MSCYKDTNFLRDLDIPRIIEHAVGKHEAGVSQTTGQV
jgi:hypothetical protein